MGFGLRILFTQCLQWVPVYSECFLHVADADYLTDDSIHFFVLKAPQKILYTVMESVLITGWYPKARYRFGITTKEVEWLVPRCNSRKWSACNHARLHRGCCCVLGVFERSSHDVDFGLGKHRTSPHTTPLCFWQTRPSNNKCDRGGGWSGQREWLTQTHKSTLTWN